MTLSVKVKTQLNALTTLSDLRAFALHGSSGRARRKQQSRVKERSMTATDDAAPNKPPVLDISDYLAKTNSIAESEIEAVLASPKFRAAVSAYAGGMIPMGYAGFFSWEEAKAL